MVSPGRLIGEVVSVFLTGLAIGAFTSAMYSAMQTVILSVGIGGGLVLFLLSLASIKEDVDDLKMALEAGSIISLMLWFSGFLGAYAGSSIVS